MKTDTITYVTDDNSPSPRTLRSSSPRAAATPKKHGCARISRAFGMTRRGANSAMPFLRASGRLLEANILPRLRFSNRA